MTIKAITPDQAAAMLQQGKGVVYLDVRSQREFAAGHPQGAINIPVAEPDATGQMTFNPEFLAVAEKTLPKDAAVLVGCMSGKRSEAACQVLEKAGYADLTNVLGGFGGAKDPTGRLVQPGWSQLDLPVSAEAGEGVSYESIRRKALGG